MNFVEENDVVNRLMGLTANDVLIVSYPKTGSTFTRFVLANIVRLLNGGHSPVDFYNLGVIMPECLKDDLAAFEWKGHPLPRFVKTHQYMEQNSLFSLPKILYVLRDPRDTMISYHYYASKRIRGRFEGTFEQFIEHESFGIKAYNKHVESWLSKASWVFDYETLMQNPLSCFTPMLTDLGVKISPSLIEQAISFAQPKTMQAIEEKNSRPNHTINFDKDFTFVRNATVEQWKDKLSKAQSDKVWNESSELLKERYVRD